MKSIQSAILVLASTFGFAQAASFQPQAGFQLESYVWALVPASISKTVTLERPTFAKTVIYTKVRSGDTLSSIADRFDLNARAIKLENAMTKDRLRPGITLKIPVLEEAKSEASVSKLPPGVVKHTVRRGEAFSTIHNRFGVSAVDLIGANPDLRSLDQIRVGQVLLVPTNGGGVLLALKPGQFALELADQYGVDALEMVNANSLEYLMNASAGDRVLLPGVTPQNALKRLEQRRVAELEIQKQLAFEYAKEREILAKKHIREARAKLAEQAAQARVEARVQARVEARVQARVQARVRANAPARVQRAKVQADYHPEPSFGGGYIWPLQGSITSGYGRRGFWIGSSNFHTGVDIAAGYGAPIRAAHTGTVIEAGYGYFGLNIRVAVGNGVVNIYGHMSRIAVGAGGVVARGQIIGYEGCSGICTGPHLHFEVQRYGSPVNPLAYLP
jgi:murein DD-endopeptidase MepM/ murein hydrolase activator NlpD